MKTSTRAQRYYDMFEIKERSDTKEPYAVIKEEFYNNDLHEAIRMYHDDILPNDWIYMQFHDLLGSIADYDIKTLDELENVRHEIVDNQVDVYTYHLKKWLLDYPKADDFMSQAIASRSYVEDDGVWQVYSYAQYLAIDEVMQHVINLLDK